MAGALIDRARPGVSLLDGYLRSFASLESLTPDLANTFGLHVVDLVAAALGPTRDGAAQAEAGGVRAARLARIVERIAERACEPGFGVESLAAEFGVTARSIQLLLAGTGLTFTERVTERRLQRAWRLLAEPASRLGVAEVAWEAGYNDVAHFHRAFRRRFGETPASARGTGRRIH
jgi:transcriptional regulator GlxA family with amidase domain